MEGKSDLTVETAGRMEGKLDIMAETAGKAKEKMSYFENAQNVNIYGGTFNDISVYQGDPGV